MSLPTIPPHRMQQDGPSLSELMTALPVATLVVAPNNHIVDANVRAETLLNMARSAIVGSDIARTIRMAERAHASISGTVTSPSRLTT